MEDGLSPWGPCTHVADPEEAPRYQLHTGTALACAAISGENQRMEDVSLPNSTFKYNF